MLSVSATGNRQPKNGRQNLANCDFFLLFCLFWQTAKEIRPFRRECFQSENTFSILATATIRPRGNRPFRPQCFQLGNTRRKCCPHWQRRAGIGPNRRPRLKAFPVWQHWNFTAPEERNLCRRNERFHSGNTAESLAWNRPILPLRLSGILCLPKSRRDTRIDRHSPTESTLLESLSFGRFHSGNSRRITAALGPNIGLSLGAFSVWQQAP